MAPAAYADTQPVAGTPETVASDALPTTQINKSGIVWTQKIVGNVVYVGGNFTSARPAGVAEGGAGQVARTNLLAYDITTGVLNTSFAPTTNGEVKTIEVSADKTRLYIGGNFTQVNGVTRNHIAALNISDGSLITTFKPSVNKIVDAIGVSGSTVYLAGDFTAVGATSRMRGAAVSATNGALLPFAPVMDRRARAMVVSPDGTKVVFGGHFTTLNGQGGPKVGDDAGYGLGAVDAITGQNISWNVGKRVKNAGEDAAIWSLNSDSDSIYGTGYHYGDGGNLEGAFRADWNTGELIWVEDCHGDSYSSTVTNGVVYVAGHPHYCGTSGGYPQTDPWTVQRALAWSKAPSANVANGDTLGYPSWQGTTVPSLLTWYPDFYTGPSGQAAWSVASNSQYVVFGGDFPGVNQKAQSGLVRFAVKSIAPNKDAPRLQGADWTPTVTSYAQGTARIGWLANYDRDNEFLTYELRRDGQLVYTTTAGSKAWWQRPNLGYVDSGLVPGSTHTYQVKAIDPYNNSRLSAAVQVTVSASGEVSDYAKSVLADGADTFWRLGDSAGSTSVVDWAGFNDATAGTGVGFGTAGAINGDNNTAATFSGDSNGLVASKTAVDGPNTFAVESWFNTTSTTGGKIVGFGSNNTGLSGSYDRHVYMDGSGTVIFGVYPGFTATLQSKAGLNDGRWHQVVAMMDGSGMQLYIDGLRVARRTDVTTGQSYKGYWRVGGDNSWSGDQYFDGSVDDVSIYDAPLTRDQVRAHYALSGRTLTGPAVPADSYGSTVYKDEPDLYYRLGESNGTAAVDYSGNGNDGTYANGVTQGATGAVAGTTDTASSFDGSDDTVYTNRRFNNPTTYSLEGWFKTNSTSGGKLIGFAGSQTGNSGSHDRDVFLQNDGSIAFGTWTGNENRATSAPGYNDNKWHYVVATQSSAGMKLYVDGALAAQNGQTGAENSNNYWRIGGDTTWGGASSSYLRGSIDEIAVYSRALSASDVLKHYDAAVPANVLPTASFTSASTDRTATFDASASSDTDGTITSYAWEFGDGTTGTGATPTHKYPSSGSYSAKLTVTDNRAGTSAITHLVTITAPAAPTDPYGAAVAAEDPDLYWRLGEQASASAAVDASGSGNGGTYFGDVTKPTPGALAAADTAAAFDGSGDGVYSDRRFSSPSTFALELWFKTGTTSGGKLIGFGSQQTGQSNNYDRHVYLQDNGQLVFGSYAGYTATITSPNSYNDNAWHYVVAQQSSDGQRLFVDGALVASGGETGAQPYDGYWRIGGDNTWGSSSPWYAGSLDEVAVYSHTLSATEISDHFALRGTTTPANVAPAADFTSTSTGFGLAVDGSASSDSDGTIASYSWTFGDGGTSTGATATHSYLAAGTYDVTLTVTDDDGATGTVSKSVAIAAPNAAPVAAFTSTADGLSVAVDGSGSSDSDGTVASYSWNFGDGTTETGATAHHTYSSAGDHIVALTVTDDDGATNTVSRTVTVTAPNVKPTAAFSSTVADLAVSLDASAASDSDGTVASYSWNFGDSTPAGSGRTTNHTYGAAGAYDVTLTVTDDKGATDSITKSVTVTAAPPVSGDLARDAFDRNVSSGLGSADVGGAWTTTGTASRFSVNGTGNITSAAGSTITAVLGSVSSTDTEVRVTAAMAQAATGGSHYISVIGRRIGTDDYRVRFVVGTTGAVTMQLQRNGTTLTSGAVTGLTLATGDQMQIRLQVSGTSPTTIRAKAWKVGTPEPAAWRLTTTDSTAGYQTAGSIGLSTYLNGAASSAVTTRFDNLWAGSTSSSPAPQNAAPTAAFTSTASALSVAVDGNGSKDTDGSIVSYAWDFGDNGSATGVTANHVYSQPGTYQVKLTVTDNGGATGTITAPVTVAAAPPANVAPTASFTGSTADLVANVDGSGSSDPDGTIASYAWNFGDNGSATGATASHTYSQAGTYQVTLTVTDNSGATGTVTSAVTVTAPAAPPTTAIAADDFNRTVTGGWGNATTGGTWTLNGPASYFSTDGAGRITTAAAGKTIEAYLNGVAAASTDMTTTVAFGQVPAGGSVYATLVGRKTTATDNYRVRIVLTTTGKIQLQLQRGSTTLQTVTVSNLTMADADRLQVRFQVTGTNPTTLNAKAWKVGTTEPAGWQATTTDTTPALQAPGAVGLAAYFGGGVTSLPSVITFDDLLVTEVK